MATATETLISSAPPSSQATRRAMAILLAINAIPLLVLPIVIGLVNGREFSSEDLLPYLLSGLLSVLPAQLFLLAFWMAFGAWPDRWRSVSIFVIAVACGLYFGLSFAVVYLLTEGTASEPDAWIRLFVVIIMTPITVSGLLWMLSAIFIIPAWCFGYEIGLRSESPLPQPGSVSERKTFSLLQLLIWTAQVALPLGALNLLLTITEDRAMALRMIIPFLTVLFICTPLTVAMLTPRLSRGPILASGLWCLFAAAALWAIPSPIRYQFVPWQAVFVFAVTIAGNLVAFRWIGFCWRVKAA